MITRIEWSESMHACMDFDVAMRLQGCFLILIIQYERTVGRTRSPGHHYS
jgi:hypothetical protein